MWLYVPDLESSPSAPDSEDSSSASESPYPDPELFATSSGKLSPRPLSWRGWRNRPWVELLYGTISRPSTASRGAARWISSLRGSLVSRGAPRGAGRESQTSGGSGRTSSASFGRFNPDGSFSRTLLDLFEGGSSPSSVDWPASGSMRSGVCSARDPWVPPISVRGSSSSRGSPWDRNQYPTPSAVPYGTSQNEGRVSHDRPTRGTPSLETGMRRWATPRAARGPWTQDKGNPEDRRLTLEGEAQNWPTPNSRDWKDTGTLPPWEEGLGRFATRRDQLARVAQHSFHPDLTTSTCGPECSPKHRRLNPRFVSWLIGLPPCWSIARIGSGPSATELSHWLRLSRFALSRLVRDGSFR